MPQILNAEVVGTRPGLGWPARTVYSNKYVLRCEHHVGETSKYYEMNFEEYRQLNDAEFKAKYGYEKSWILCGSNVPITTGWHFNPKPIVFFGTFGIFLFVAIPCLIDWRRHQRQRLREQSEARGYPESLLSAMADRVARRVVSEMPRRKLLILILAAIPMLFPGRTKILGGSQIGAPLNTETRRDEFLLVDLQMRESGIGWPWKTISFLNPLITLEHRVGTTINRNRLDYAEYARLAPEAFKAKFGMDKGLGGLADSLTRESGWQFNPLPLLLFLPFSYFYVQMCSYYLQHPRIWWRVIEGRCISCGYELTGLTSAQCPECGRPVKLEEVEV